MMNTSVASLLSLEELKTFIQVEKRLPSQGASNEKEKSLGNWCNTRRYERRNEKLDDEKIEMLEAIPFWSWDLFGDAFAKTLEKLKAFIQEQKRLPNKRANNEKEKFLGQWCSHRRMEKKKGKLDEEKIEVLQGITLWYWVYGEEIQRPVPMPVIEESQSNSIPENLTTSQLYSLFQDNPTLFHLQGTSGDDLVTQGSVIVNKIQSQLSRNMNITNFGAGTGKMQDLISSDNTLIGLDYISTSPWIHSCNLSDTNLPSYSQDISLITTPFQVINFQDIIIEATRILKPHGHLIIIRNNNEEIDLSNSSLLLTNTSNPNELSTSYFSVYIKPVTL